MRKNLQTLIVLLAGYIYWLEAIAMAAPGEPRILTHPTVPSDDVIIYTHDVRADYGADNTGAADCTALFQKALDDAHAGDGGIVFAPAGRYKVAGHLTIPPGVTLLGEWRDPDADPAAAGTILCAYETGRIPFITLEPTSTVRKLSVWYPEQSFAAPKPYPWTFWASNGSWHGIEAVTLYNSYSGINEGGDYNLNGEAGQPGREHGTSGNDNVKHIYGTCLNLGLYQTNAANTTVFGELHFSSKYWIGSGLPGAPGTPAEQQALRQFMRDHVTGLKAYGEQHLPAWWAHLDCTQYHKIMVEDAMIGIDCDVDWSDVIDVDLKNVKVGIDARETEGSFALGIMSGKIDVLPGEETCGVRFRPDSNGKYIPIQGLTIGGRPQYGILFDGKESDVLNVMKCAFTGWEGYAIEVRNGSALVEGCTFAKAAPQIHLAKSVRAAAILGNTWTGPRTIANDSPSRQIKVDDADLKIPDLPATLTGYQYIPRSKPPHPGNFYNVAAAPYGAVKGGKQDCTAAIQKALGDAAAAGGGTVFVPGGVWRLDGTLTIPGGVELRGINGHPHNHGLAGTNLYAYAGKGDENAAPFITMEAGARASGFFVFYPEMALDYSTRFPWTIRGKGADLYIRNISFINSWNGLDLATNRCDRFRIAGISGGTKNLHIYIGGGSEDWVFEDCMNNWSYDVGYPSSVDGHLMDFGERARLAKVGNDVPGARLPYKLGDTRRGVMFSPMVYDPGDHVGLRLAAEGAGPRDIDILLAKSDVCMGYVAEKGDNINMAMPRGSHDRNVIDPTFAGTINEFMEITWFSSRSGAYPRVGGGTVNIYQATSSLQAEVNGGSLKMVGVTFAGGPLSASRPAKVVAGPGAKSVELIGCAAAAGDGVEVGHPAGVKVVLQNNIGEPAEGTAAPGRN